MPTYDYACMECAHTFEHFQSIASDPLSECPECGGKLRRLIGGGGAVLFKGSGFYQTDYKGKWPAEKKASAPSGPASPPKKVDNSPPI